MTKTERCPICDVSVKPENLLRHVDDNHPRHPDAASVRQRLAQDARYAPPKRPSAGPRIKGKHLAVVAAVVLVGAGLYYGAALFDPYSGFNRDSCIPGENVPIHIHVSLEIRIDGSHVPIPTGVGRTPTCTKPLHTHDDYNPSTAPALIHIETPVARTFVLGDFFHIWGQPFSSTRVMTCIAGSGTSLTMTVSGLSNTEFENLVLADGQSVVITCGASA